METKRIDRKKWSEDEFKRKINITNGNSVFEYQNHDVANFEFESKFVAILESLAPMGKNPAQKT